MTTETTPQFQIGDRVRVKPKTAPLWNSATVRRRVAAGVEASITAVAGKGLPPNRREYKILFDKNGRFNPMSMSWIDARDLEPIAAEEAQP